MTIRRVVETCLYVSDVARSSRWYADVLGFERAGGSPPRDAFLKAGDTMLLLFDAAETMKVADVPSHGANGIQHVAFAVDELGSWRSRLTAKRIPIVAEHEWGRGRSLYFHDPDGHVLELVTRGTWSVW